MEDILGEKVDYTSLNIVKEIGAILFEEFRATILYLDADLNFLIKEWVDCSDDGGTDRYFYYRTTRSNLTRFFKNKQTHSDLIRNAEYGLVYFQDVTSEIFSDLTVLPVSEIPADYIPSKSFSAENMRFF